MVNIDRERYYNSVGIEYIVERLGEYDPKFKTLDLSCIDEVYKLIDKINLCRRTPMEVKDVITINLDEDWNITSVKVFDKHLPKSNTFYNKNIEFLMQREREEEELENREYELFEEYESLNKNKR